MKKTFRTIYVHMMERRLWRYCRRRFRSELGLEHGPGHWKRVAAFGRMLCDLDPSVDRLVVNAFACMHDVERLDNCDDLEHGPRAAMLVKRIRRTYLSYLNDEQIGLLSTACELHTTAISTESYTVNACFDADRLDLLRCGISPDPARMASVSGADIAAREDFVDGVWKYVNETVSKQGIPVSIMSMCRG